MWLKSLLKSREIDLRFFDACDIDSRTMRFMMSKVEVVTETKSTTSQLQSPHCPNSIEKLVWNIVETLGLLFPDAEAAEEALILTTCCSCCASTLEPCQSKCSEHIADQLVWPMVKLMTEPDPTIGLATRTICHRLVYLHLLYTTDDCNGKHRVALSPKQLDYLQQACINNLGSQHRGIFRGAVKLLGQIQDFQTFLHISGT